MHCDCIELNRTTSQIQTCREMAHMQRDGTQAGQCRKHAELTPIENFRLLNIFTADLWPVDFSNASLTSPQAPLSKYKAKTRKHTWQNETEGECVSEQVRECKSRLRCDKDRAGTFHSFIHSLIYRFSSGIWMLTVGVSEKGEGKKNREEEKDEKEGWRERIV